MALKPLPLPEIKYGLNPTESIKADEGTLKGHSGRLKELRNPKYLYSRLENVDAVIRLNLKKLEFIRLAGWPIETHAGNLISKIRLYYDDFLRIYYQHNVTDPKIIKNNVLPDIDRMLEDVKFFEIYWKKQILPYYANFPIPDEIKKGSDYFQNTGTQTVTFETFISEIVTDISTTLTNELNATKDYFSSILNRAIEMAKVAATKYIPQTAKKLVIGAYGSLMAGAMKESPLGVIGLGALGLGVKAISGGFSALNNRYGWVGQARSQRFANKKAFEFEHIQRQIARRFSLRPEQGRRDFPTPIGQPTKIVGYARGTDIYGAGGPRAMSNMPTMMDRMGDGEGYSDYDVQIVSPEEEGMFGENLLSSPKKRRPIGFLSQSTASPVERNTRQSSLTDALTVRKNDGAISVMNVITLLTDQLGVLRLIKNDTSAILGGQKESDLKKEIESEKQTEKPKLTKLAQKIKDPYKAFKDMLVKGMGLATEKTIDVISSLMNTALTAFLIRGRGLFGKLGLGKLGKLFPRLALSTTAAAGTAALTPEAASYLALAEEGGIATASKIAPSMASATKFGTGAMKWGGRALGAVGAGFDFYDRMANKNQTALQAGLGVGGGMATGALLGTFIGGPIGTAVGGALGYMLGSGIIDKLTGADDQTDEIKTQTTLLKTIATETTGKGTGNFNVDGSLLIFDKMYQIMIDSYVALDKIETNTREGNFREPNKRPANQGIPGQTQQPGVVNASYNSGQANIPRSDIGGYGAYAQKIGQLESGGSYQAVNTMGYLGKYQFGVMALETEGLLKPGTSKLLKTQSETNILNNANNWLDPSGKQGFLSNPDLQEKIMLQYTQRNYKQLEKMGLITPGMDANEIAGRLAASHLIGAEGYRTKGLMGKDFYGTSAEKYYTALKNTTLSPTNTKDAQPEQRRQIANDIAQNPQDNLVARLGRMFAASVQNNNVNINSPQSAVDRKLPAPVDSTPIIQKLALQT